MPCAGLLSSVRLCFGQPCSPFEAGALPVLRPTRRIHIRLRGRVLCNPPRLKGFRTPARASPSATPLRFGGYRLRPKTKPRSAPSRAGLTAPAFVTPFGEKRDSSRALHPPSAARYFVGGIPPSRLARVRYITRAKRAAQAVARGVRITRTVVAPFPCACSSHIRR